MNIRLAPRLSAAIWIALLAALSITSVAHAETQQEAILNVEGMICSGCEATVEAVLTGVDGVHEARADRTTETVAVVYDPAAVEPAVMVGAINRDTYYQARYDPTANRDPATADTGPAALPSTPLALIGAALAAGAVGLWLVRHRLGGSKDGAPERPRSRD